MIRTALLLTVICFHVVTFSLYSGAPVGGDGPEAHSGVVTLSLQDDSVITIDDILILVFTGRNTRDRMHTMLNTWLRHIPPTSFMVYSDEDNTFFPNVVNVGGGEEDHFMSTKVPNGILDAWRRFPNKKWFYKVDDDTFVHVHNLVQALNQYNWTDVQYIGHRMEIDEFVDCNGGAGYVFSWRLMKEFMPLYERCMTVECGRPAEDQCTAICIRKYFRRECEDHLGFNTHPNEQAKRAPDCKSQCISVHSVLSGHVYHLYRDWYNNTPPLTSYVR